MASCVEAVVNIANTTLCTVHLVSSLLHVCVWATMLILTFFFLSFKAALPVSPALPSQHHILGCRCSSVGRGESRLDNAFHHYPH